MDTRIFDEAFASLPESIRSAKPACALMLGSGWSRAVEGLEVLAEVPYGGIPHFGDVTVIGHSGRLLLVRAPGGGQALVFCGRRHWYEGAAWEAVVMPVEIARRLGCTMLLVTNASGGIRPDLEPGDMVVIRDHIRMNHLNPFRGPHNPAFGPRFPDQSHVYDPALMDLLLAAGRETGHALTTGVYVFASGPAYETPAEIRAYGLLGADLVGMSTVPEAMFANACGVKVAGLSFVSNHAAGIAKHSLSGAEVVECAEKNSAKMASVVLAFLAKVLSNPNPKPLAPNPKPPAPGDPSHEHMNEKILFDTDIGSDIDDALALAYLLREPRCELLGITTVTSFPERRAEMCSVLCRHAGRPDIPIHVGAPQALMSELVQKTAAQAAAVSGWDHASFAKDNTAIEFLYRTIAAHPGEITLLAVGPMTNIALLFMAHPEAPGMLKQLVLMSGRFAHGGGTEWNVINDAHAAAVVYGNFAQSRPPVHYSCGLDVTTQCTMERDECRKKFAEYPILAPVRDFAEVWFERSPRATFHDPLAAVSVFDPEVCKWRDARVVVSTTPPTNGVTVPFYTGADLPHKIGETVDSARFFERYFGALAR